MHSNRTQMYERHQSTFFFYYICFSVSFDSGWQIYKLKKENKEIEVKIRNNQLLHTLSQLNQLEELLVERQQIFCSFFKFSTVREQLEDRIRKKVSELQPLVLRSDVEVGLEKIFWEDRCCASWLSYLWTGNKRRNGGMMWEYLKNWRKLANKSVKVGGYENVSSSLTVFSALHSELH